jgi:hypothetical protein
LVQETSEDSWDLIQENIGVTENGSTRYDIAYLSTFEYEAQLFALYNYSAGFGKSGIYLAKVQVTI